ncbi:triphosphoribosyl-dephospho-CoA synthase [Methanolobus sp. ZRKC3]|uniref:triphosphoribosyl-dephospho-CoA synthase n=1 Tax=Methanolobus sp. ZRKC3 TaxID=3125786 RepID=UPI00324776C1
MNEITSLKMEKGNYPVNSYIARCAQLAMCLEVSSSPKPGNIDRYDDYEDTRYEHFLASAISMYPVMEEASGCNDGVGRLIKNAVTESVSWQKGGNTHFGAIILLVPLAMAAGRILSKKEEFSIPELTELAHTIVRNTNSADAADFYSCFETAGVKVNPVDEFDLQNVDSIDELQQKNVSLYNLMEIASSYDLIANEWVYGFKRCTECADLIVKGMSGDLLDGKLNSDINDIVVYSFLKLLSENEDTFITTKFDTETANYVSERAQIIVEELYNNNVTFNTVLPLIRKFNTELLERRINPGSTADIIIAGLFIALLGGVRY